MSEIDRLVEAYAKSMAVYYATEKAFLAKPTTETMYTYHIAVDRFRTLREEIGRANRFGDALVGTEADESVAR